MYLTSTAEHQYRSQSSRCWMAGEKEMIIVFCTPSAPAGRPALSQINSSTEPSPTSGSLDRYTPATFRRSKCPFSFDFVPSR